MGAFSSAFAANAFDVSPAADTTAPTWPGGAGIAITGQTSTGYTATAPSAADAVGVTAYRWRVNAGAWTAGQVATVAGRTPGSTDALEFQARDAAGNWSVSLTKSVTLAAAPDTQAPVWAAGAAVAITAGPTASAYTVTAPAATDNSGAGLTYRWTLNGAVQTGAAGASFSASGRTSGNTDVLTVTAIDQAGNESTALTKAVTLQASTGDFTGMSGTRMVVPAGNDAQAMGWKWNQQPHERLDYILDFGDWIAGRSDAIASHELLPIDGMTIYGSGRVGDAVTMLLGGGEGGFVYSVTARVTTTDGIIKEASFKVRVGEVT